MNKVNLDYDHIITDEDAEIDVEIDYKCWISKTHAFYPMTRWSSIHQGLTLQQDIENGKTSYEKDYIKVEVVNVRVDLEPILN